MIPEFKTIMEEAEYRLKIKKEISNLGGKISAEEKGFPTDYLVKMRDDLRRKNGGK